MNNNTYLQAKRAERLNQLVGKWIVLADNTGNDTVLYFQDPSLVKPTEKRTSQWTRYLVNAQGFESADEARKIASGFRYGHPRIAQV